MIELLENPLAVHSAERNCQTVELSIRRQKCTSSSRRVSVREQAHYVTISIQRLQSGIGSVVWVPAGLSSNSSFQSLSCWAIGLLVVDVPFHGDFTRPFYTPSSLKASLATLLIILSRHPALSLKSQSTKASGFSYRFSFSQNMEGIIPFVFKVIAQYKEGEHASFGALISYSDEPSAVSSYVLLPGDSDGRHRDESNQQLCSTSAHAEAVTTCTARASPIRRSTLRRRA